MLLPFWPPKVRPNRFIGSRRLEVPGYLVTAPNLVGHASRVSIDYSFSAVAQDLRPYIEARNYALIVGHSWGAATTLSLLPHLPASHPTTILLVDPPMQQSSEKLDFLDDMFTDACLHVKPAVVYADENPLWTREDTIYMELGTRLCAVDAVHGIFRVRFPPPCLMDVHIWLTPDSKIDRGTFSIAWTRSQRSGK